MNTNWSSHVVSGFFFEFEAPMQVEALRVASTPRCGAPSTTPSVCHGGETTRPGRHLRRGHVRVGRHGQDARGATGCFLTECWDLRPDAVTFGKSIGGGAGHPVGSYSVDRSFAIGAVVEDSVAIAHVRWELARALCNGAALLNRLTSLRSNVQAVEKAVKPTLQKLRQDSAVAF